MKRTTNNKDDFKELREALHGQQNTADSGLLLSELLSAWGGPQRLARDIHEEFRGATRGSLVRQRILEMIQRLVINNTQQEIARPVMPSDLSDTDLEAMLVEYARRLSTDVVAPAKPEEPPIAARLP